MSISVYQIVLYILSGLHALTWCLIIKYLLLRLKKGSGERLKNLGVKGGVYAWVGGVLRYLNANAERTSRDCVWERNGQKEVESCLWILVRHWIDRDLVCQVLSSLLRHCLLMYALGIWPCSSLYKWNMDFWLFLRTDAVRFTVI